MKLFNPEGIDTKEQRKIFGGNTTNLVKLSHPRYQWASKLYQQMRNNFWIPQKIDLTVDKNIYSQLLDFEQKAFKGIISYLNFLDSIQVCNLAKLEERITAPEIKLCLTEQKSQEGLHGQSYQYILESLFPVEEHEAIYDFWRTDKVLSERCKLIASYYQAYIDSGSDEDYFSALIANYALEGIYFYNGLTI